MPSPIGHLIAGATIAWSSDLNQNGREHSWRSEPGNVASGTAGLALTCSVIAAAPDLDLLLRAHRTYTHSIGATMLVAIVAGAVAAAAGLPVVRVALICAAAHASHILLDWMAVDRTFPYGVQAFWPFSREFYISGLDLFRQTERRHLLTGPAIRANVAAVAKEVLILGPPACAVWLIRVKTLAGLSAKMAGSNHAAK